MVSSDDSDSDHPYSKIKPEWLEAQKNNNFDDEEWPNSLPSINGTSAGNSPIPSIEHILKMIRSKYSEKNVQNGGKENVQGILPDSLAIIGSTINKQDLEDIMGTVSLLQSPPPLPPPQLPPRPPPPQPQSSNIVSTT